MDARHAPGFAVQIVTLLFYAVASFFLGVIATGTSAAIAVALGEPTNYSAPIVALIVGLTFAAPLVFLGVAVLVAIRGDVMPGTPRQRRPQPEPAGPDSPLDDISELLDLADQQAKAKLRK